MQRLATGVFIHKFITPYICSELIRLCEDHNIWTIGQRKNHDGYNVKDDLPAEDTFLNSIPEAAAIYEASIAQVVREAVSSIAHEVHNYTQQYPWIARYTPERIPGLQVHTDNSDITLIISLNNQFEGGGTYFPKLRLKVTPRPGYGILFYSKMPHRSVPVTSGKRYILVEFFKLSGCN
jgi:hypothetical protein